MLSNFSTERLLTSIILLFLFPSCVQHLFHRRGCTNSGLYWGRLGCNGRREGWAEKWAGPQWILDARLWTPWCMCNEQYPLPGSAVLKLHRKLTNKGLTIYHEDRHVTKLTYAVYVCHFYWVSVNEKIWYFFGDVSALSETYLFFLTYRKEKSC